MQMVQKFAKKIIMVLTVHVIRWVTLFATKVPERENALMTFMVEIVQIFAKLLHQTTLLVMRRMAQSFVMMITSDLTALVFR